MININTLNELNTYGFGADIDKLESYVYNSKQAQFVSRQEKYEFNYMRLSKILKELKPESIVFTDKNFISEDKNNRYKNTILRNLDIHYSIAYGVNDDNVEDMANYQEFIDNNDIVAIPNIDGIHVSCIYTNGKLSNIYMIGESQVYNEITDILKDIIPNNIEALTHNNLVDCRAVITIFNSNKNNIASEVIKNIRNRYTSQLNAVFYDMFIHGESPYSNMWDKIEYMREIGMSVPHHALVRDIQENELKDACIQLYQYFEDIKNTTGINYTYSGIIMLINNIVDNHDVYDGFIYNCIDSRSTQLYESIIRSISIEYKDRMHVILNIVPTSINDRTSIDKIEIHDISLLKTYELYIGKPVLFYNAEGTAVIAKKYRK